MPRLEFLLLTARQLSHCYRLPPSLLLLLYLIVDGSMSSSYLRGPAGLTMFSARIEAVSPAVSSDGGVPVRTRGVEVAVAVVLKEGGKDWEGLTDGRRLAGCLDVRG